MGSLYDAVIIGAGPGGLLCARTAARRGLRVALAERQAEAGRKLALAGGAMGNYTNRTLDTRHYVGENPEYCRPFLRTFGVRQALDLLRECGIPWEEREFGQIFGLKTAATMADALLRQCREAGAEVLPGTEVKRLRPGSEGEPFLVVTEKGPIRARQVVIASGGPACPQSGATDFGIRAAASLGHRVIPFRPALVPLRLPAQWPLHGLEGISLNAVVLVRGTDGKERHSPGGARSLLFTHQGLSGPACLLASCFWNTGDSLSIDFLPENPLTDLLHAPENGKLLVKNLLARQLPSRLAERLTPPDLAGRKSAELGKKDRLRLAEAIHRHAAIPTENAGFRKAEAARGGVATGELGPNLESRVRPGLFFCGEITDITGLLGGYNIHWALASGFSVGMALTTQP